MRVYNGNLRQGVVAVILTLCLLPVVVLSILLISQDFPAYSYRMVLLSTAFGLHLPLLYFSRKGDTNLFNPLTLFILVTILVYLLKLFLIETVSGVDMEHVFFGMTVYDELYWKTVLYICIGTTCFYIGYTRTPGDSIAKSLPTFHMNDSTIYVFDRIMLLLFFVGVLSLLNFIYSIGGVSAAVEDMVYYRTATADHGSGFLHVLSTYFRYCAIVGLVYYFNKLYRKRKTFAWALFTLGACFLLPIVFLATGSRTQSILPLFCLLASTQLHEKRLSAVRIGAILIGIVGLINFLQILRGMNIHQILSDDLMKQLHVLASDFTIRIASNLNGPRGLMSVINSMPDYITPTYGRTFLQAFGTMLPHSLIPFIEGSETIGNYLARMVAPTKAYYGGGFSPGFFGMLYLNFMGLGVVVLSLLFGALSRVLYVYVLNFLTDCRIINASFYSIIFGFVFLDFFRTGDVIRMSNDVFAIFIIFTSAIFFSKVLTVSQGGGRKEGRRIVFSQNE